MRYEFSWLRTLVPDWTKFFPSETTIAELRRTDATASIGKWHLMADLFPTSTVDELAGTDKARRQLSRSENSNLTEARTATISRSAREEAVKFIERTKDKPNFLYLAHFAVHTPIQGRADLVAKYKTKIKAGATHTNAAYAAMVESLDASVGRVRAKLDDEALRSPSSSSLGQWGV
jgi:arylsulfatase A-like enzyme